MTEFTRVEQLSSGIYWFACDLEDLIGCFIAMEGQLLPSSVAQSKEEWQTVDKYLFEVLPKRTDADFIESSREFSGAIEGRARKTYESWAQEMGEKGIFFYDAFSRPRVGYFCASVPRVPLTVGDLPLTIASSLTRTRLPLRFREALVIDREW